MPIPVHHPEQDLLAAFSHRYRPILERFFERRVPIRSDVDDLTQEVFLRLARTADLASITQVEAYLFETAANVLRDRARHSQARAGDRHEPYEESRHAIEDFSPERVLTGRQTIGHVAQALLELPERTRVAFVLHRFEGLRHPEIARRLGLSVSSVEKYIMQALAHIKERLGE